nr:hypothetical protein Iba_scaffold34942CG0020 [Ipomoea batatas]GME21172.1 hypothetical protein Iba_scaffold27056CG0010 [Ipomoea batatas]
MIENEREWHRRQAGQPLPRHHQFAGVQKPTMVVGMSSNTHGVVGVVGERAAKGGKRRDGAVFRLRSRTMMARGGVFQRFTVHGSGLPPTISVAPVKWQWSIKSTSVPIIIFRKIWSISAQGRVIMKPAFISRGRHPSSKISRIISSPATRRGSIPIHEPSRRTIHWGARRPETSSDRQETGMTSPRTPSRCVSGSIAVVTVLSSSKVQVVAPTDQAYSTNGN